MTDQRTPQDVLRASGRYHWWVAKRLGIDPSYVSHLIHNRRPWSPELRQKFCLLMDIDEAAIHFAFTTDRVSEPAYRIGEPVA